jgi:hypothetical protein
MLETNSLMAIVFKYRPKSTFRGTGQKIDFAHILSVGYSVKQTEL